MIKRFQFIRIIVTIILIIITNIISIAVVTIKPLSLCYMTNSFTSRTQLENFILQHKNTDGELKNIVTMHHSDNEGDRAIIKGSFSSNDTNLKIAILSDDGVTVKVDGKLENINNYEKGQPLPVLSKSLFFLSGAWASDSITTHTLEIQYSNISHPTPADIDGLTVFFCGNVTVLPSDTLSILTTPKFVDLSSSTNVGTDKKLAFSVKKEFDNVTYDLTNKKVKIYEEKMMDDNSFSRTGLRSWEISFINDEANISDIPSPSSIGRYKYTSEIIKDDGTVDSTVTISPAFVWCGCIEVYYEINDDNNENPLASSGISEETCDNDSVQVFIKKDDEALKGPLPATFEYRDDEENGHTSQYVYIYLNDASKYQYYGQEYHILFKPKDINKPITDNCKNIFRDPVDNCVTLKLHYSIIIENSVLVFKDLN